MRETLPARSKMETLAVRLRHRPSCRSFEPFFEITSSEFLAAGETDRTRRQTNPLRAAGNVIVIEFRRGREELVAPQKTRPKMNFAVFDENPKFAHAG